MISNPGNPTGVVLTPEQMRMIADIAKEHGLFLIADEVYREFIYGDEPLQSMGAYRDLDENLILIDSVSKRFSACGARIGVLITRNQTLQQHALKICQARLSVATLDQVASRPPFTRWTPTISTACGRNTGAGGIPSIGSFKRSPAWCAKSPRAPSM